MKWHICDIHLIASKAVIEKEVSEGVVKVRTQPDQTVSLVGVGQLPAGDHNDVQSELFLPEKNVSLLHRPGKHHGLLVVHVVVRRAVHNQVLLVRQLARLVEKKGISLVPNMVTVFNLDFNSSFVTLAVTSLLW